MTAQRFTAVRNTFIMGTLNDFEFQTGRYRKDHRIPVKLFGKFIKPHYELYHDEPAESRDARIVADFLASLTDQNACDFVTGFFVPKSLV